MIGHPDDPQPFRYSLAFVCSAPNIEAVQRRATPDEAVVLDEYRDRYKKAVGYYPHGLHYIPMPGQSLTVPVWFLPTE